MKSCYIVAAGDFYGEGFAPDTGDIIIAADGGLRHLERLGVSPTLVVGDFDSYGEVPTGLGESVKIEKAPPEKDDTDTVLCVRRAFDLGCKRINIFGGTGGRFDHSFANVQTLSYILSNGGEGYLFDDGSVMTVAESEILSFEGCEGTFSVFALTAESESISIRGAKYEIENYKLRGDMPLGVSNEFSDKITEIEVGEGRVLLYWQSAEKKSFPKRKKRLPFFDYLV